MPRQWRCAWVRANTAKSLETAGESVSPGSKDEAMHRFVCAQTALHRADMARRGATTSTVDSARFIGALRQQCGSAAGRGVAPFGPIGIGRTSIMQRLELVEEWPFRAVDADMTEEVRDNALFRLRVGMPSKWVRKACGMLEANNPYTS